MKTTICCVFIILWSQNNDDDFSVYKLYESLPEDINGGTLIYDLGNFSDTNEYMELAELKKKEVEGVFDLQINEHPFNLNVNINNYISGSKICIKNAVIYYNNDDYEFNFENKIPLSSGSCIELQ